MLSLAVGLDPDLNEAPSSAMPNRLATLGVSMPAQIVDMGEFIGHFWRGCESRVEYSGLRHAAAGLGRGWTRKVSIRGLSKASGANLSLGWR